MADNKALADRLMREAEEAGAMARISPQGSPQAIEYLAKRRALRYAAEQLAALTATPSAQAGEARGKWTPEHINELLENMDRWRLVLGKGDRWEWSVSDATDLIRTLLANPQPQGDASPQSRPSDGVICVECGLPTMHIGNICYACSHPKQSGEQAPTVDGEAVAVVISNAVGVEIAWSQPPSAGRPPVGTKLYTRPAPAPDVALVAASEKLRGASRKMDDGSRWVPGSVFKQFSTALTATQQGATSGQE